MSLLLRCIALNDQTITKPLIGRFDERGGTLGRSDEATLTLPDPARNISRLQAHILYRDGQYWIENISEISPVLHNGHPVATGMQVALREGDELRIGGYSLRAGFENSPESEAILRGRSTPGLVSAPASKPLTASTAGQSAAALNDLELQRAVLQTILARLNPEKLEVLLGKRAFLEHLWPMRRRARLWQLYMEQYDALREATAGDFQRAFGEAFRAAYDSRVRKLSAGTDETVAGVAGRSDPVP